MGGGVHDVEDGDGLEQGDLSERLRRDDQLTVVAAQLPGRRCLGGLDGGADVAADELGGQLSSTWLTE